MLHYVSGFRRNDGEGGCWTFYEFIKIDGLVKSRHSGESRSPDDLQLLEKIRQSALAAGFCSIFIAL
jgi:hypothetical protein